MTWGIQRSADDGPFRPSAGPVAAGWTALAAAVCVPVRNERRLLPALLGALAGQRLPDRHPDLQNVVACFLFDGCDDDSAAIVQAAAPALPFRVVTASVAGDGTANAGRARHAALALGQRALAGRAGAALLTTDADSAPAPDWLAATMHALGMADVVAGRIVRDAGRDDSAQDRIEAYLDRLYMLRRTIDPVLWEDRPAHHHVGGASLAFRAEAYHALGGFAHRPAGEDAAIVDAAHVAGLRVRRDRHVVVHTSSRRIGRATDGLADHLRRLDGQGGMAAMRVAHPADSAWQYHGHAAARAGFSALPCGDMAAALAARLAVDAGHVRRVAAASPNAEAFAMRLVPAVPGGERLVPLAEAEHALDAMAATYGEEAA